eukprot:CAMPEP_0202496348 /NCGR_PEP_ID=MMETSP1361-20130828/19549_1 /ASSEMBLY_ACC=CAM_ASM_000849 /TAXON_ID=210615 /ORGANISM="Staurosira complex sp., Strain CCMP2646" /LENGTH=491 /DNA_ID=CAMNT_0049127649 /DNA_START=56 /DNA_END=1531 /DNA_ORIENTATION=+
MSSNKPKKQDDGRIESIRPDFRSVQIGTSRPEPRLVANAASIPKQRHESEDVIDKASFFKERDEETQNDDDTSSNWCPTNLRLVPAFYPLEKSSRFIDDDLASIATRVSECLRLLSVQAIYNNEVATASLLTGENVEMHLSLWKTAATSKNPEGIVVELQRRKGDSIVFHRYSRHILDAAIGDFDFEKFADKTDDDFGDKAYSKKAERLLRTESGKPSASEEENAIIAIEIAHGLLMKDRMDARQLGLESLCLLTDPSKTGAQTALIASHVVLLGTAKMGEQDQGMMFDEAPFQEIRETILSLVQLRRIGDEEEFSDDEEDEKLLQITMSDEVVDGDQEKEHLSLLHNLALAVMANALDVVENFDAYDSDPEDTERKMPARGRTTSADMVAKSLMDDAKDITKLELLSTLINELGKAENKPHNARLSAKCLNSLFRASKDARKRARDLGAKNVVNTALDVGTRTHAKLETECKSVVKVLTETADDDAQDEE